MLGTRRRAPAQRLRVAGAMISAAVCAATLCSCMTFEPLHRREVEFAVEATHDQFMTATKNASERLGGSIIERPIFTPKSAELIDSSRRDQSSIYIGFMTPMTGAILDSVTLKSQGEDSAVVQIRSYYPLITGSAIQEELDFPRAIRSVSERRAAATPMTEKSRWLFDAITLVSPALANTYLLTGNPFAGESPELVSILVPLVVDAGFAYFALATHSAAGAAALGTAAVYMRLSGLFGLSAEIDRYNTIVRSGYHLNLEQVAYFRTQLTANFVIP